MSLPAAQASTRVPFDIKTTEAMHYRRYIIQRQKEERMAAGADEAVENENAKRMAFRTAGVSDGRGFVFVSHRGEVYPSGFLALSGLLGSIVAQREQLSPGGLACAALACARSGRAAGAGD